MIDLTQYPEIIVKQEIEFLEVFMGFETANRYSVRTPDGAELLFAYEESGMLSRMFLRNHRPLTIHFVDNDGNEVFTAERSFFWMFSHLHVGDEEGKLIGSLQRTFKFFGRRIAILDDEGTRRSEIRGSLFRPHTFMVYSEGDEVARITKRWSGLGRELFSDADTFQVRMNPERVDQEFATIILAAAIAIDLDFFEKGGRGGMFS